MKIIVQNGMSCVRAILASCVALFAPLTLSPPLAFYLSPSITQRG